MSHVAVTIRYLGSVVDEQLLRLADGMVLGDDPEALVTFPSAKLTIRRDPRGWTVSGHRLVPGRCLVLSFGEFEVGLETIAGATVRHAADWSADLRLLIATAAFVLFSAWVDTVYRAVDEHPQIAQAIEALILDPEPTRPVARKGDQPAPPPYFRTELREWTPPPVGFTSDAP